MTTPKTIYWPDREPDGTIPAIGFKPCIQSPAIESIPALLKEKWGDQKDGHAIFFNAMDWKDKNGIWHQPHSTQVLKKEGTKDHVCVETSVEHVWSGMWGWDRACGDYFQQVCETIYNEGYGLEGAYGDLESPNLKTHYEYHRANGTSIKTPEVIKYIYANGRPAGFPRLDADALQDPSPWKKPAVMQSKYIWDHFVSQLNAEAFDRVFGKTVRSVFGDNTVCNNYGYCRYDGAPAMIGGHPMPNAPVGAYSAFVAYLHEKAYFQDVPTLKAAMRAISGPPEKVWVWVQGPWQFDRPEVLSTPEKFQEIWDFIRECGFNGINW